MKLELEIAEITVRGTPNETITAEAIAEAAEAELQRLAALYGAPSDDLVLDLDGLVLEVEPGVTARTLGERIAVDIASRWRGLGSTEPASAAAEASPGVDAGTSAKI